MQENKTRRRWTYDEFAKLPESGSTRYEVIDDELVVTPSPGARHQRIVRRLLKHLLVFVDDHLLGEIFPAPFDVLFAEGDYLEPDILFVRGERSHVVSERGVEGPPDLVIEVISPSTAGRDRGVKLERYRLYGVGEYWVVDPVAATIELWRLERGASSAQILEGDDVLAWAPEEGATLEIPLPEIFAD